VRDIYEVIFDKIAKFVKNTPKTAFPADKAVKIYQNKISTLVIFITIG